MMALRTDVEVRTREIGRSIFALARRGGDGTNFVDRWSMQLSMRDERVKAALFRFVDVLPTVSSSRHINALLHEYMEPVADRMPPLIGKTLRRLPAHDGWLGRRVADAALWNVRR